MKSWLDKLHISDRKYAIRWLREMGGEARLHRICKALPRRKKGQPGKDRSDMVALAMRLFVTTPGLTEGEAAGRAANHFQIDNRVFGAGRSTAVNFVSKQLKAAPREKIKQAADAAYREGQTPRADMFPELAAARRMERYFNGVTSRFTTQAPGSEAISRFEAHLRPMQDRIAKARAYAEHVQRLGAFMDLFAIPDDTPISQVNDLFHEVEGHVRVVLLPPHNGVGS